MTNDNQQPLLIAGKLPKDCYRNMQEFVNDLPKVLLFPLDAVAVIKGAKGDTGLRGPKGGTGDQGPAGEGIARVERTVLIGAAVTFVEFDAFTGWQQAIYTISSKAELVSADITIPIFDPADGIVGVGSVIGVFAVPRPTKVRCYFVFAGGITATPNANFVLKITHYQ